MAKLKPRWVKTDIPKDIKIKLWRLMRDNPTYRSWEKAIVGKSYISAQDKLFASDELKYIKMSRDTYKALQYEVMHMPAEEVPNLPPDLQSWVKQLRPELESEKYPRREAEDYSPITNLDAIVLMPGLERRHKIWALRKWLGLDEGKIAEKFDIPLGDVQRDIEETKKELVSKTKEVPKMEQDEYEFMLKLPRWVEEAQTEHLEGKEQRDERGGIDVITYPGGLGIRQRLEFFRGCFSEISPWSDSFWHPPDEEEIVVTQLRGHLPDEAFWDKVKDFIAKDKEYKILRNTAYERYTSAGEELVPLEPAGGPPTLNPHITSAWARRVLVRALTPELGLSEHFKYYHQKVKDDDFMLIDKELIYRGPDDVAAERKHRDLVDDFINNSEEFSQIVSLMKQLRDLRQKIIARIDQCLRGREYSYNYCPDCPADQARKMLAGK